MAKSQKLAALEAAERPDGDQFFRVEALAVYLGFSVPTIRRLMRDPERPLPAHHICRTGKTRGVILASKREVDAWVAANR